MLKSSFRWAWRTRCSGNGKTVSPSINDSMQRLHQRAFHRKLTLRIELVEINLAVPLAAILLDHGGPVAQLDDAVPEPSRGHAARDDQQLARKQSGLHRIASDPDTHGVAPHQADRHLDLVEHMV